MKTLTFVAAFIVALTLPVASYAQTIGSDFDIKRDPDETATQIERRKADEKAYKESLSRNPNKEFDPWAAARETPPAAKQPAPKKKPPAKQQQ